MAKNNYAVLDIQNDDDELQFQEFGAESTSPGSINSSPSHTADQDPTSAHSPWTFQYYQSLFDVDTKQVLDRIFWSFVPRPGVKYAQKYIRNKPDLYGPVWVGISLVFAAAVSGNVSQYLQTQGEETSHPWRYDFHKVWVATLLVFSYEWLVPLMLWLVLLKIGSSQSAFVESVCLYGYSLSVLVPVCILWTIPLPWLRWCVGLVGVVLSGTVLATSVHHTLSQGPSVVDGSDDSDSSGGREGGKLNQKVVGLVVFVVVVGHIALAAGFMMYFFSASQSLAPHTHDLHAQEHKISRSADQLNASIEKLDATNILKPLALHRDLPSALTNGRTEKTASVGISTNERTDKTASVEISTNERAEKADSVGITASKVVEGVNASGGLDGGKDVGSVSVAQVASNSVVTLTTLVAKS